MTASDTPLPTMPRLLAPLVLAALLGACGTERQASEDTPAGTPDTTPASPASIEAQPSMTEPVEPSPAPSQPLAPVRQLQVTVEGQVEQRIARLFESPQGYAIYVLPQIEMTQEEPCCDLAYARVDDGYFMRIERIAADADAGTLREDMVLALSSVGKAEDAPRGQVEAEHFHDAELHMRARNEGTTMHMLVASIGDGRYRVTLHLPHREASEGIVPTLWAMLGSLQTTGPLQRP